MYSLFQIFHYKDSVGKRLKNIISNAWVYAQLCNFYRESKHFEAKVWWSRSEIEEKFMSPNS